MVSWIVHMQSKVEWLTKNMTKKRMGRVTAARKAEKEDKSKPKEPSPSYTAKEFIHPLIPSEPPPSPPPPITYQLLRSDAPPARGVSSHFPLAMNINPIPDMATFPETLHKRPNRARSGIDEPMEEKREREKKLVRRDRRLRFGSLRKVQVGSVHSPWNRAHITAESQRKSWVDKVALFRFALR